jgi:2-amino-4-hydroxy-6-hydroxymethyldihydropteridine diphosphokinase
MESIYLSLGSNLGNPENNLKKAISCLKQEKGILLQAVSNFYRTSPLEYKEQPDFLNCIVEIHSPLEPLELWNRTKTIEKKIGNVKPFRYGPRNMDIDIILYGDRIINEQELQVPHPKMHLRAFVLIPLAELNPLAQHPLSQKTVKELIQSLPLNPEERVLIWNGNKKSG